jgi:hypothetical protein
MCLHRIPVIVDLAAIHLGVPKANSAIMMANLCFLSGLMLSYISPCNYHGSLTGYTVATGYILPPGRLLSVAPPRTPARVPLFSGPHTLVSLLRLIHPWRWPSLLFWGPRSQLLLLQPQCSSAQNSGGAAGLLQVGCLGNISIPIPVMIMYLSRWIS